jgi:hypothetical protein
MRAQTRGEHAGAMSGRRRAVRASVLVAAVALAGAATMGTVSTAGAATSSLGQRVIDLTHAAAAHSAPGVPSPQVTGLPPISKVTTASGAATTTTPQVATTSSGISATYSGTTLSVLWDTGNSLTVSGAGPLGAGSTVITPSGSIAVGGSHACSSAGGLGVVSITQFAVDGSGAVTALALEFGCVNSTLAYAVFGTVGLNVDPGTRTPGYNLFEANGAVTSFGTSVGANVTINFGVGIFGDATGLTLNQPMVGMATTSLDGGYWMVAGDGGVFSFGDASFYGSTGNLHLNKPVVGMAATPDGKGYWFVASDGGIFSYGDAHFYGSTGNLHLNKPIVGMAATPDGKGYWLVASDGGIFSFGDARFHGSTGNLHLNKPIVGMAVDQATGGYWLVAADGGIFSFGAPFFGSAGALPLNSPIVGMTTTADAKGYWFTASDGGVFSYGDAAFGGSLGDGSVSDVVGMAR